MARMSRLFGSLLAAIMVACCAPGEQAMSDDRPAWDAELARPLLGKTVLIGLTYRTRDGSVDRQEQLYGTVRSIDAQAGIEVELAGTRLGDKYWLPPQTSNFHRASPGTYRLKATGEDVVNPDYVSTWEIGSPTEDPD